MGANWLTVLQYWLAICNTSLSTQKGLLMAVMLITCEMWKVRKSRVFKKEIHHAGGSVAKTQG
jgi:hypothetical protein